MRRRPYEQRAGLIWALLLLTMLPAVASAQDVEAGATAALDRMGAYLRTLKAFQVTAETSRDVVLENGLKAQFSSTTDLLARLPDRLRADVAGDLSDRRYVYDGKEFTLLAERLNYYATVPAPPTIGALANALEERFDIELPLVDLFRWGSADGPRTPITLAVDLGASAVDGTTCTHYAFRQAGLDWQIWIQRGDYPLPRRLVLTTTTDEARPEFEARYEWNLAPSFNESAFVFEAPEGAHRIALAEVPAMQAK
ncbi:MAG: DUF2092 domain-containing protein [Thermoanaerobaculia bacterium]